MDKYKITQNEINENNVKSAADLLKGEPRDNKNIFDRLPELIANKVNGFIDAVISKFTDYYNKAETEQKINEKVTELGKGDMAKAVYDTDGDGVVDNAKNAENGVQTYTQSAGTLSGSGTNGKFKATETGTYTVFTIGGVSYAVKAGSETEIELTSGVWYSFILDEGAKTINFKAGGAGLNFKIVGGTTQPSSPKENTIWVNTDTAIGEYQFSATQPTARADGTELQNGDVWFGVGSNSNGAFSVLKKPKIEIYPRAAKQYIDGAWVKVTAMCYQNGSWKSWTKTILNTNGFDTSETGSFSRTYQGGGSGTSTVTVGSNKITMYVTNTTGQNNRRACVCSHPTAIDVTGYSELRFHHLAGNGSNVQNIGINFGVATSPSDNNFIVRSNWDGYLQDTGYAAVDISSVTGLVYIKINMTSNYNGIFTKVIDGIELS